LNEVAERLQALVFAQQTDWSIDAHIEGHIEMIVEVGAHFRRIA